MLATECVSYGWLRTAHGRLGMEIASRNSYGFVVGTGAVRPMCVLWAEALPFARLSMHDPHDARWNRSSFHDSSTHTVTESLAEMPRSALDCHRCVSTSTSRPSTHIACACAHRYLTCDVTCAPSSRLARVGEWGDASEVGSSWCSPVHDLSSSCSLCSLVPASLVPA